MRADTTNASYRKATKQIAMQAFAPLPQHSDWAQLAIEATSACVLILDESIERILWKSPSFDQQFPVACELDRGHELREIFQGLSGALTAASKSAQTIYANATYINDEKTQLLDIAITQRRQHLSDKVYVVSFINSLGREQAERRRLEDREKLLFTSRAISVGEMATTLAHELNQPIGSIANLLRGVSARMRQNEATDNAELIQAVTRATEQAQFASRIIARIREFTHSRQPKSELVDVNAMLKSTVQLLDWELSRDTISVELNITEDSCETLGDAVMLEQVLVNLIRNAIDAMRSCSLKNRRLALTVVRTKSDIEITVCDSGSGMSDEAEANVFVPFVSTKPTGMGIGLSICRSFVEMHQGRLWFKRNSTAGVTFHLSLPAMKTS
jgi:two-component system, LuxR family, sensor kinase FixL